MQISKKGRRHSLVTNFGLWDDGHFLHPTRQRLNYISIYSIKDWFNNVSTSNTQKEVAKFLVLLLLCFLMSVFFLTYIWLVHQMLIPSILQLHDLQVSCFYRGIWWSLSIWTNVINCFWNYLRDVHDIWKLFPLLCLLCLNCSFLFHGGGVGCISRMMMILCLHAVIQIVYMFFYKFMFIYPDRIHYVFH